MSLNNIFTFNKTSVSLGLTLVKCLTWSQKDGNENKALNNSIEKTHIRIVFHAQWNASISLVILNYWWHILCIHFQLSRSSIETFVHFRCSFWSSFTFRWSFIYWFIWSKIWSDVLAEIMCYFVTTEIRLRNQNCNCWVVICK